MVETRIPPRLEPGDKVCLLSPASFPDPTWVVESVQILEGWGLSVEVGEHVMDRWGFMAGPDQDRLEDLNRAIRDRSVRAIITTTGGAGAYRIADDLDFEALRSDPKPVVGFSDISYLHLAVWYHCATPGIHGCLAGSTATETVRRLLMSTEPLVIHRDPAAVSAAVHVPGLARGRVIGGNLAAVATSIGVRLPDLNGSILFLEDRRRS